MGEGIGSVVIRGSIEKLLGRIAHHRVLQARDKGSGISLGLERARLADQITHPVRALPVGGFHAVEFLFAGDNPAQLFQASIFSIPKRGNGSRINILPPRLPGQFLSFGAVRRRFTQVGNVFLELGEGVRINIGNIPVEHRVTRNNHLLVGFEILQHDNAVEALVEFLALALLGEVDAGTNLLDNFALISGRGLLEFFVDPAIHFRNGFSRLGYFNNGLVQLGYPVGIGIHIGLGGRNETLVHIGLGVVRGLILQRTDHPGIGLIGRGSPQGFINLARSVVGSTGISSGGRGRRACIGSARSSGTRRHLRSKRRGGFVQACRIRESRARTAQHHCAGGRGSHDTSEYFLHILPYALSSHATGSRHHRCRCVIPFLGLRRP